MVIARKVCPPRYYKLRGIILVLIHTFYNRNMFLKAQIVSSTIYLSELMVDQSLAAKKAIHTNWTGRGGNVSASNYVA
jgi:hypothetical protein